MTRPKSLTAAAIIQFVWGAAILTLSFPDLAKGATPEAGGLAGYTVTTFAFAVAVLTMVAAWGIWTQSRSWRIIAIGVNVLGALPLLGAVLFASPTVKLMAGALLLVPVLLIVLLLARTSHPVQVQAG